MREILFRGKTDKGEWVKGLPTRKHPLDKEINRIQSLDDYYENDITVFFCVVDVYPETVGQYTGLTDKNGKKIFEGDIVKDFIPFNFTLNGQKLYEENTYIVEYSNKKCGFSPFCEEGYDGIPIIGECVVIGNIHDNPELLKGGE